MHDIGLLEHADAWLIRGWAIRSGHDLSAELLLVIDGKPLMVFRPQWAVPAISQRLHLTHHLWVGFQLQLPKFVSDGRPHQLEVRFTHSNQLLERGLRTVQKAEVPIQLAAKKSGQQTHRAPLVSVVVLNRNGAGILNDLLESWETHNQTIPVEWVVIDHHSTDNSLQLLRGWKNRINLKFKALKKNDSFSASCNLGAELASCNHLLFLNNDLVWQQDALPEMMRSLTEANVVAVGLKLLKVAEICTPTSPIDWTEVQHLGIRFQLHTQAYAPFEANPYNSSKESEFAPQDVAAVTGAALLCRKDDFFKVGGFDTRFFYGFEDVELCLRMTNRLSGRIICRNDLFALHRHGHTRLTGREQSISDRLFKNEQTLQRQIGLWLKRAWWHSLLSSDRLLCTEQLTIALWAGPDIQTMHKRFPGFKRWVSHLPKQLPNAKLLLVDQSTQNMDWRDVHVLISPDPLLEPEQLNHKRPDLKAIGWVSRRSHPSLNTLSSWPGYDQLIEDASIEDVSQMPDSGLTNLPSWLIDTTRWRAVIVMMGKFSHDADTQPVLVAAHQLEVALHECGHSCISVWENDWISARSKHRRLVDVCVVVSQGEVPEWLDSATLNVMWRLGNRKSTTQDGMDTLAPDRIFKQQPTAHQLGRLLETRIGRTFFAS